MVGLRPVLLLCDSNLDYWLIQFKVKGLISKGFFSL